MTHRETKPPEMRLPWQPANTLNSSNNCAAVSTVTDEADCISSGKVNRDIAVNLCSPKPSSLCSLLSCSLTVETR